MAACTILLTEKIGENQIMVKSKPPIVCANAGIKSTWNIVPEK